MKTSVVLLALLAAASSAAADGCVTLGNGVRYCSIKHCQTQTWRGGWWASKGCRHR